MITSTLDNRNNMGQPPPELVRDTILQQDAQFREQVQELHRVHEIQVCLMAEMQKQDETKVDATTHASVTTKNKNPWMMMQAPLSKAAYQVSGSRFRHEQITQGAQTGEEERYATSVAHVEQARQFLDGGRKLGKRRIFDLERPPEENMDEDEDEASGEAAAIKVDVEAEELRLRLSTGWAQQADDVPLHQDHLSAIPSRANDIVHKAPFHPTPTSATQRFLGGRWGLSLERKMNEAEGDCQPADVSHKKQCCSRQLDIESNPSYHCTKMAISPASLCKASGTGTALTRSPQQDARNEDTWFHEQQQQNTWAHSAVGVYQAPSTPQMYAPFKISNETMPLSPASRKGEGPPSSSFAPPVYNQAYALASAAVPVQLQPYEGPIALPGQGIVMSAMNVAARYSHSVPSVQQGGWQPVNAFQADSGAICAFPATAPPPLAFNVNLLNGSWTAGNPGPPFLPFSVLQPPKVSFKKPPKLVLQKDDIQKEMKLVSPKKDLSPSVSSGEEVGGSLKEQDDSQGEGNPFVRGYEGGQVSKPCSGWVPKTGGKQEREQTVLADPGREEKFTSSKVARSPVKGLLKQYGDEACLSDGSRSGSGSGETGMGNVINPGEFVGHLAPSFGSGRVLPAGNRGVDDFTVGELGMQQEQLSAVDRWNWASTDGCGYVRDATEDGKHQHQGCKALKPQHSSTSADPTKNSAGESTILVESTSKPSEAYSLQDLKVEETIKPNASDLSPESQKNSPQALAQGSCTTNEDENLDIIALPGSPTPKLPPQAAISPVLTTRLTAFTSFHNEPKLEAESSSISSPKNVEVLKEQQEANGDIVASVHV
ncbi:unnamed protein product [Sphagnum jensenii]|uniref:Uncharacterized protein n=1 Tax=Sphagnum jensenii TaxID=128206 RepID=A0ABP0WCW0_9BRYO